MTPRKLIGLHGALWAVCLLSLGVAVTQIAAAPLAGAPDSITGPAATSNTGTAIETGRAAALEVGTDPSADSFFSGNRLAELQLILEDFSLRAYWRLSVLQINSARLFHDIDAALGQLAILSGFSGFLQMLGYLAGIIVISFLIERAFRFFILRVYWKTPAACPLTGSARLSMSLQRALPKLASLLVFIVVSYALYSLFYSSYFSIICPAYLAVMLIIVTVRLVMIGLDLVLSPGNESFRLIKWNDKSARVLYFSIALFISLLIVGNVTVTLLKYGGLEGDSLILARLFFGTLLIASTGIVIFLNRGTIASLQVIPGSQSTGYRGHQEAAGSSSWYWLLGLYLLIVWLIWCSRLVLFEADITAAFTASLLIVPIFLVLDGLIIWLSQRIKAEIVDDEESSESSINGGAIKAREHGPVKVHAYLRRLRQLLLAGLLLLWVLHLWGIDFTFSAALVESLRKVITVFLIFFIIWQIIDKSIGSMLSQEGETEDEKDDDAEGEWGGGKLLDRRQTLLPIVRKFMGIVVLVFFVLFTLSSLGVNIGPLLAGAGVMGIAIGFGAQKLVSDLLSGFFYLIDDAFRVGEYIEAGAITGTVEKITLRNLMLRHHRGMLQIIPYSDLGAITNYMRGGIVVKFNLQLPYDTDVEQVRKVIKRVGLQMLEDPEIGKNFVSQLKSQGIREVGDSVLTIRVKFTAKPGTHFVIRREAFRRITEELKAKGIYYAHRKVIVDLPEETRQRLGGDAQKGIVEAGAAAALASEQKQQGEAKRE